MADDDARVDPRYDPAFQRGFEGEVKSAPRGRAAVRRTAIVAPAPFREAPDAVPEDEVPRGQTEARVTRSAPIGDDDPRDFVPSALGGVRRLARNPFLIALAVLGTALVVVGAAWLNEVGVIAGAADASTEGYYWFLQASIFAAPLTIAIGIGIWVCLLFTLARAWGRG